MTDLSEFNISVISSELDFFVPYRIVNRALAFFLLCKNIWVIPREVAQENPRPPSILMKIDKPKVPHDRNMYAQF